jgi:hypothetical protein
MAAVDAQFYWMSAKIPNDEFLLYAFGGEPTATGRRRRCCAVPGLAASWDWSSRTAAR